jgi:hypothetical protein
MAPSGQLNETINSSRCLSLATPTTPLQIRPYEAADWPAVWALLEPVFRAGEAFPHDPAISEAEAQLAWVEQNQAVMMALDAAGAVVGTYYLRPNSLALGAHVANAGYVVADREADTWASLQRWPFGHEPQASRPHSPVWLALPADWQEHPVAPHRPGAGPDGRRATAGRLNVCARCIDPRLAAPSASGVLPHRFR